MKNKKNTGYWGKGNLFKYEGNVYQVKDTDIDKFYQTDFERIWLKYKPNNDKYDRWIDSILVKKVDKRKK